MSYGALKRLEIARALARRPKMLLLDEPAAGLNQTRRGDRELIPRSPPGITVVLVEHDMKLVMGCPTTSLVLDYGSSWPKARRTRCAPTPSDRRLSRRGCVRTK